jgi:tyrosinase
MPTMRVLAAALCAAVALTSVTAAPRRLLRAVVRKDWNKMSRAERKAFTDAVNALKLNKREMPATPSYDDLVLQHREAYRTPTPWVEAGEEPNIYYRNGDQKGPVFLPWHRQQLMVYEAALQAVSGDPTMGIPYWNYMVDASTPEPTSTALWTADDGIGGDGRPEDNVVADGPFAMWPLKYADLGEEYLERRLGALFSHPGDAADFVSAFDETTYDEAPWSGSSKSGFRNFVEGFHAIANSQSKVPYPGGEGSGCTDEEECGPTIQLHAAAHAFVGASMINST